MGCTITVCTFWSCPRYAMAAAASLLLPPLLGRLRKPLRPGGSAQGTLGCWRSVAGRSSRPGGPRLYGRRQESLRQLYW